MERFVAIVIVIEERWLLSFPFHLLLFRQDVFMASSLWRRGVGGVKGEERGKRNEKEGGEREREREEGETIREKNITNRIIWGVIE